MATLSENAQIIAAGYNNYRDMIQRPENADIVVPKGTTTIGSYAFWEYRFNSITIPDSVTTIGYSAFHGSSFNTALPENVSNIGSGAFQNCEFTTFTIPENVTRIMPHTFRGNHNLVSISFPSGLLRIDGDGTGSSNAFTYCTSLREVVLPDTCVYIADSAFGYCQSLETVHLPTSLSVLGRYCFNRCAALTTINIPNCVVGEGAFAGCTNLENVTVVQGYNETGLNLSYSTKYSVQTIVSWLNALADRTGDTAYTLTIGSTNLAKLTAEQIAIATNKNWNLA